MKKTFLKIAVMVAGAFALMSTAMATEPQSTVTVTTKNQEVVQKLPPAITSGELVAFKPTYVFGSIGSTTNGKSSTVGTVGIGRDLFTFNEGHVILGVEGAITHFTGKRLNTVNNTGHDGFGVVDKKNLVELGVKASYQFNQIDPINIRLYGKAGIASSSLNSTNKISPYFGAGAEFAVNDSNFVWFAEVKQYTNLRKAQVYYAKDSGSNFNTRKDNTVMSVGLQYRF